FTDAEFDLGERLAGAESITLDALYMTRLQRERQEATDDDAEYLRVDADTFQNPAMRNALLMHPLPRTGEVSTALDRDPRVVYFRQSANGVPVRKALIALLLERRHAGAAAGVARTSNGGAAIRTVAPAGGRSDGGAMRLGPRCGNPNCITRREEVHSEHR